MGRRLSAKDAKIWAETGKLPDWYTNPKAVEKKEIFLGIDGEGQTSVISGRHKYTMLAAADERGFTWYIKNMHGLSTYECLEFIFSLPLCTKAFAYSFGYDITKILTDLDDVSLYKLLRPELRRRLLPGSKTYISVPVLWPNQSPIYSLNYLNGRLSIAKIVSIGIDGKRKLGRKKTINDIWRFFQGKFTNALEDWNIPGNISKEERAVILQEMRDMKDKRSKFDKISESAILAYCLDECRFMAELARKLTDAHIQAGIPLKNYFGAGSSASVMLEKMGIDEHVKKSRETELPKELEHAIACAFFGGRFENSVIGTVYGPIYSYDISSAYPYQQVFLPCLIHGSWRKTQNRRETEDSRTAIVHYRLSRPSCIPIKNWAPFPFRTKDGSITFPEYGSRGWIWADEFFSGEKLFPNAAFLEAWIYETDCDCQPFASVPPYYRERLRIGKEGPGIVLKLGINSCYGKTAQFIGGEPGKFTSWIWAGMITSGCRAQILRAMAKHKNLNNLLMIATDGIATREKLELDIPRNTNTGDCIDDKGRLANKPLGGWEEKIIKKGLFLARPGIYFPVDPTADELKSVRARGLGRSVVYEQWQAIVDAFEEGLPEVHVKELSRFIGAKTAITRAGKPGAWRYTRSKDYGQWITRPVEMSFHPMPKRARIVDNAVGADKHAMKKYGLELRKVDGESAPYSKSVISPEAAEMRLLAEEAYEQPDGGDLAEMLMGGDFGW